MEKIDTLYKKWTDMQPLSLENQKRLDQKFMLEFNYNSNHIEGNTLTYGQTKLLLMFGETTGDAKLRDYEEMKAHNVGLELVKLEAKDKERPLTENYIRELNRIILVEDFHKISKSGGRYLVKVGQYKMRPNSVITATGEMFDYASPEETPALMADLVKWYNEEAKGKLCPIQLATLFHYRYIRIHPFEDGNGRIARLLVNYILMRHGYPMIIVQSKDKENYLNVLHKCDIEVGLNPSDGANAQLEQVEPFLEYMESIARHALEMSIRAAKGESIEEDNDFAKRIALLEKEAKQQHDEKKQKMITREDKVINILSSLYLPLRNNIVSSLKSAACTFYQQEWDETYFSKNSERKNAPKIENIEEWIKNASTESEKEKKLSNIKSLFYVYILRYPKDEYKILPSVLAIRLNIQLEDEYYTISTLGNKQFSYSTYPSEEEMGEIVSTYKTEVLGKIGEAIHGAK